MTIDWTRPLKWMNNSDMTVSVLGDDIDKRKVIKLGLKHDPLYASFVTIEPESGCAYRHGQLTNDKFNRVKNVELSLEERVARLEKILCTEDKQ